ncbi:MAG: hypothetical protein ACRELD_15875 [Longimicrobiales bacterium]
MNANRPLAALLILVLAACADDTPDAVRRTYALVRVNGQELPFTDAREELSEGRCRAGVRAGTLTLDVDGAFRARYDLHEMCMRDGITETENIQESATGSYEIADQIVQFFGTATRETGAGVGGTGGEPSASRGAAADPTPNAALPPEDTIVSPADSAQAAALDGRNPLMQGTAIADTLSVYDNVRGLTLTWVRRRPAG